MSDIKSKESDDAKKKSSIQTNKRKIEANASSIETNEPVIKKTKLVQNVESKNVEVSESKTVANSGHTIEEKFKAHQMLHMSYQLLYTPCGVICSSKPKSEPESQEYSAYVFSLNNRQIKFRVAKTTPTKSGQFVTLWKRLGKGSIIQPCCFEDPIDVYVICVKAGKNVGQFVFSKEILASKDILSKSGKGGKRAIRVYAPWVKTESSQASNTKSWQTKYFINLTDSKNIDLDRVSKLYGFK